MNNTTKFLWCDLETTGLDPNTDKILEIGFVVTNAELETFAAFNAVIGRSPADLVRLDPYVRDMHNKNGLLNDCIRVFEAAGFNEAMVYHNAALFIAEHFPTDPKPSLFGSSIHFDRSFIKKHCPEIEAQLHYRMVDVSSFKLLAKEWYGKEAPKAASFHRVIDDLGASIAELKFYRENVFTSAPR